MTDNCRQEFEKWIGERFSLPDLAGMTDDRYSRTWVADCWQVWQAAWTASLPATRDGCDMDARAPADALDAATARPRTKGHDAMTIWTETSPTKSGWYWWRFSSCSRPEPVQVTNCGEMRKWLFFHDHSEDMSGEWGPEIVFHDEPKWGK